MALNMHGYRWMSIYVAAGLLLLGSVHAQVGVECTTEEYDCSTSRELGMTPVCIPLSYVCDETEDCALGEDELDCDYACSRDQYRCADGTCIPDAFLCDFIYDCYGRDDEANCSYPDCAPGEFRCETGHCIAGDRVCNNNWDCGDGSDETEEMCSELEACDPGQFVCTTSGECIDYLLLCNEQQDCTDNSDEATCQIDECNPSDGSGSPCAYQCQNTLIGYNCLCPTGHRLTDDQSTCEEVNECMENPLPCDQGCQNTNGSYICSCTSGYTMAADGRTCKADADPDNVPFLVFANRYYVRQMGLDGSDMDELLSDTELVHVLDFDSVEQHFYYADARHGYIRRIDYAHDDAVSDPVVVNWHNLPLIEGIAVDWIGRKLYWTDSTYFAIATSELNGTHVKTLISGVTQRPRGIVVAPSKGYVFWTDWHVPPFIARMGMDGSDFKKIVTDNIFWPNGISHDPFTDRIWWADAYLDNIQYSDLDGNNRYTIAENMPHVYAISIFEEWVYLTDWNIKTIEKANRFTGENRTQIASLSHEPYDIHVVHPSLQPISPNPCGTTNGGCSHLCLIAPGGTSFTCACPNDFELNSDNMSCTPACSEAQFECNRDDHRCIPARWVCDGEPDCKGGEDETANCPVRSCPVGLFQCEDSTEDDQDCAYFTDQCDGHQDCRDVSDEVPEFCQSRVCLESEFLCNDTGRCIPGSWECDGEDDCQNGMDESETCEVPVDGCQDGEFTCDNGQCIPQSWWCDLDDDCGDNSDEANRTACWDQHCPDGWRRCVHSYRCIPEILFCDHQDDCRDNSDEPDDPALCPPCPDGDYQCHSGQCIPERWRCDFMDDCEDGTDEGDYCPEEAYPDCDEGEFRCANHRCIRGTYLCDTDNDCLDNSDESDCPGHICEADKFQCASGHCIPASYQCDQDRDCPDASDEVNCPDVDCYSFEFRCDNTVCIPSSWRCDTDNDCGDNSDETLEVCLSMDCQAYSRVECDNGRCVRPSQLCDRHQECEDGSDENNFNLCTHGLGCDEDDMFRCNDGQHTCIDQSLVCDLYEDCANATDEIVCRHGTADDPQYCTATSCMHTCTNNTDIFGHYCHCNDGYAADPLDRTACVDIDECSSGNLNYCPQICTNTKGGYACECVGDFLNSGPSTAHALCEPPDSSRGIMLVAIYNSVRQLRIEEMEYTDAVVFGRKAYRVATDSHRGLFYWADDITKEIYRAFVPPSGDTSSIANTVISSSRGLSRPSGLAIDWIAMNLYFTDRDQGRIYVTNADGNYMKILISGTERNPTYIALSPEQGLMFWVEPYSGRIMSAWMDGSNEQVLLSQDVIEPSGIVVDHFMNNRVYWSDLKKNTIESMNSDGTDRIVVLAENLYKPYGLDILFDQMFWISEESGTAFRMDKFGRGVNTSLITGSGVLDDIAVHHSMKYPNVTRPNPCASNPCWPLCLLTPTSYTCACPEGAEFIPYSQTDCMEENAEMNSAGGFNRLGEELANTMPILCPCVDTQLCENIDATNIPSCECRDGVDAPNCVASSAPPGTQTTTADSGAASETVAIIVVILILIVVLVLVVLFFAYRRGMFLSCMKVKTPGGGTVVFENPNHGIPNPAGVAPVVEYSVNGEDLSTRFSNPMYDKLNTNLQPGATPAGDPQYEELPVKVPPTGNGHFSSA